MPSPPLRKKSRKASTGAYFLRQNSRARNHTPQNTCAKAKNIGIIYAQRSGVPRRYRLEETLSQRNG